MKQTHQNYTHKPHWTTFHALDIRAHKEADSGSEAPEEEVGQLKYLNYKL